MVQEPEQSRRLPQRVCSVAPRFLAIPSVPGLRPESRNPERAEGFRSVSGSRRDSIWDQVRFRSGSARRVPSGSIVLANLTATFFICFYMTFKCSSWRKFAKFMSNHLVSNKNRKKSSSIINIKC